MKREDVYKIIDSERDYQDKRWGNSLSGDRPGDGSRSIDEFALYIVGYTNDLQQACSHFADPDWKLEHIRKIAGLCVACMEQHDTKPRT